MKEVKPITPLKLPIYMDNHATTQTDPMVVEAMLPFFTQHYGNASSLDHSYGSEANHAIEKSRNTIAKTINAKPEDIIFTGGATESDNIAIQGIALKNSFESSHIITTTIEHKAILDTCKYVTAKGCNVTYVPVDSCGMADASEIEAAIRPETVLISVMFANNEIGTIQAVEAIGKIARKHNILFHTDAAQAVGHVPVDVEKCNIDMMSISAHKLHGPKGVGALYVRRHNPRVKVQPVVYGGGQERGLRSGTLNVPGIVGFAKAVEISSSVMPYESRRIWNLVESMRRYLEDNCRAELNGSPIDRLPHNLNMYFPGVESKALIQYVNGQVAISAGSACTTAAVEASHVLLSMGFSETRAHSSVRFGLSRFNTEEEVVFVLESISKAVSHLRGLHRSS